MSQKDPVRFNLDGAKEIDNILKKLPVQLQATLLRNINREAAKITQAEMIKNAPPGSDIPDNIKIKNDTENKSGVLVAPTSKVFWARFLEYGTKTREGRGSMSPQPFIKKSIDNTIEQVVKFITGNYGELINKYLEREVKKVNRKNNKN